MAKLIVGSRPFDMAAWDLSDIATGTVTASSATEVDVTGSGGRFVYQITGTGFTTFDTNGFPTDGTVTGLVEDVPGKTPLTISGISISASDFMGFVNGNDATGLETAVFSGNDSFLGKAGNDVFNLTKGGNDTASGGDGNDTFNFGTAFTAADSVDGGAGSDKVTLSGDYSGGVTFSSTTMTNVEALALGAGHTYNLTLNATTDQSGQPLAVTGTNLSSANQLILDGSAAVGALRLVGGAGNDILTGGAGANTFVGGSGDDTIVAGTGTNNISGGAGNDTFTFANWISGDIVNGVSGSDTLVLNGDFSGGVTLTGAKIANVPVLEFTAGHSYDITLDSHNTITDFYGTSLGAGDSLVFDASASTGFLKIVGGAGDDTLQGNNSGDQFDLSAGGNDTMTGGAGPDEFDFGGAFTTADTVNGGGGSNRLVLNGTYSSLVLGATGISNIETLSISGGTDNSITTNDADVAAGQTLTVDLGNSNPGQTTTFDGSAETDGKFDFEINGGAVNILTGGANNDMFSVNALTGIPYFNNSDQFDGGAGYNTLVVDGSTDKFNAHTMTNIQELDINTATITTVDGNVAAGQTLVVKMNDGGFNGLKETDGTFDISGSGAGYGGAGDDAIMLGTGGRSAVTAHFEGAGGADTLVADDVVSQFIYAAASDSTSVSYDTIEFFDQQSFTFRLPFAVAAVDAAVDSGALSTASFDSDLAAAIGSSQLGAHHAVVFTPNSGTLSGDHFLVIDANGTAGYQAGQDIVVLLENSTLNLTTANFTT